jgi:hypothetical protein
MAVRSTNSTRHTEAIVIAMEDKTDDDSGNAEKESTFCPLFMDGLPRDFSSNPQLAALASLMNDDENDDEKPTVKYQDDTPMTKKGGGKIDRKARQRRKRQDNPYTKPATKTASASVAEAHLFLKMWNIKE